MKLEAAAASDVGRRRAENEDRYAIVPELGLYVVADGMGGHSAGSVASALATEAVVRAIGTLEGSPLGLAERLRSAVAAANREVFRRAASRPELAGMGTTLVALLAARERAALAHVGDSRAYRLRAGGIRQLTDDHTLVGELVRRRELTPDAARSHPQRHVLTRALGVRPDVDPDLAELALEPDDLFLLCSDGLTGHVSDDELAKRITPAGDLRRTVNELVELANQRGGEDNITVVLVRCRAGEGQGRDS